MHDLLQFSDLPSQIHGIMLRYFLYSVLCLAFFLSSCSPPPARDLSAIPIIPKPVESIADSSSFGLRTHTDFFSEQVLQELGVLLISNLTSATGQTFVLKTGNVDAVKEGIVLQRLPALESDLGAEGYRLNITEDYIKLTAAAPVGICRGIQTLRQVVPIQADEEEHDVRYVATGTITDYPNYGYRGMMLDVARHFFAVKDVKRLIDYLTLYKINHLHLHLSDDKGWRCLVYTSPSPRD